MGFYDVKLQRTLFRKEANSVQGDSAGRYSQQIEADDRLPLRHCSSYVTSPTCRWFGWYPDWIETDLGVRTRHS